jgi:hypothetical protein
LSGEEEETFFEKFLSSMEKPTPNSLNNEKLNIFMLKRSISLILLHEGFDSITSGALDTMVDIYLEFFRKIGSNLNFLGEFSNNDPLLNLSETLNHLDPLKPQDLSEEEDEYPFSQVIDYIENVHFSSETIQKDIENLKNEIDELKNLKENNPQLFLEKMIKDDSPSPPQEIIEYPKEIDTIQPFYSSSSLRSPSLRSPSNLNSQMIHPTPQTIVPPPPTLSSTFSQQVLTPIAPHIPPVQIEEQDKALTPTTSKKRRGRPPGKKNTNYK